MRDMVMGAAKAIYFEAWEENMEENKTLDERLMIGLLRCLQMHSVSIIQIFTLGVIRL